MAGHWSLLRPRYSQPTDGCRLVLTLTDLRIKFCIIRIVVVNAEDYSYQGMLNRTFSYGIVFILVHDMKRYPLNFRGENNESLIQAYGGWVFVKCDSTTTVTKAFLLIDVMLSNYDEYNCLLHKAGNTVRTAH